MVKFVGNAIFSEVPTATLSECIEFCKGRTELGIDIETSCKYHRNAYPSKVYRGGLDPYLSRVVMLQLGDETTQYVIDTRSVDITSLLPTLNSSRITWVGANLKFEQKHLYHNWGIRLKHIWDVMLVEMNLYNGIKQGYSLLAIAKRYFDVTDLADVNLFNLESYNEVLGEDDMDSYIIDKSTRMQFVNIGDRPFTKQQILYGADDIVLPLRIKKEQEKGRVVNGEVYNPTFLHILENEVCLGLAHVELNGIPFSKVKLLEIDKLNRAVYAERYNRLNEYVTHYHPEFSTLSLFDGGTCNISWTSPKQVIPLFQKLGICPEERSKSTGKIRPTVQATVLTKMLDPKHKSLWENRHQEHTIDIDELPLDTPQQLILHYLYFKEAQQLVKTFGKDYLKYVHPITHRVHPNFFQILATGRLSSSRPNMMQWPSGGEYRKVVAAPYFWTLDFASQEIRILAQVSGVEEMRSFFVDGSEEFGSDFHSFTATRVERLRTGDKSVIVNKKTNPEARQRAKITNFAINYGAGPPNLAAQFGTTIEDAEAFIEQYMASWPGLQQDFNNRQRLAFDRGYIQLDNVTERRWFCPFMDEMDRLYKKAWAYYPDNYMDVSREERLLLKDALYRKHPEVKDLWKKYMRLKGQLERKALNYPIQSTAGSMTKYAFVLLMRQIFARGWENSLLIVNLVHDEINAEARSSNPEFGKLISDCMVKAGKLFCPDVPMVAEGVEKKYWSK